MRRFTLFIVCLLLPGAFGAEGAPLSGFAEWRLGEYRVEREGKTVYDASQFTQQYSLAYVKKGTFAGGRGGSYDIALGGEWTSLESEVNDEKFDVDTFKFLYKGDVLLAPGGLPFRLHLFSYDMNKTLLVDTAGFSGNLQQDGIATDVLNGQRIISGATLIVGIRNGSYMGAYRDILSQFPRLLVDYQEQLVRDLKSHSPQHFRDRNLAFVSLNKKDNWFHYRLREYQDFENPLEDFTEKTVMLGTVDHTLERQWINLTNWIRISTDGSYTESDLLRSGLSARKRYDLNLFADARRSNWQGATFTTFNRQTTESIVEKQLEVPVFLNGELDRNTSWRLRLIGSRDTSRETADATQIDEDTLFVSSRVETMRTSRFVLAGLAEGEVKRGDEGEGSGVRLGLEYFSNRLYTAPFDWFGAYTLSRFAGTSTEGVDVDYWENDLTGRMEVSLTSRLRLGLEEKLLLGTGQLDRQVTSHMQPKGGLGLGTDSANIAKRDGDLVHTTTTVFIEHEAAWRLRNRLEAIHDYLATNGEGESLVTLRHALDYERRSLTANMENQLTFGDKVSSNGLRSNSVDSAAPVGVDLEFRSHARLNYSPSRYWETRGKLEYTYSSTEDGDATTLLRLDQLLRYNFFKVNGVIRKQAELEEEVEYEIFTNINGEERRALTLRVAGNYFPTKFTLLGASVRYKNRNTADDDNLDLLLTMGLNYEKLKVSLDYAYATAVEGIDTEEHRWELKVKKIF